MSMRQWRVLGPLFSAVFSLVVVIGAYAQQGTIPPFDPNCTPLVHLISQNYPSPPDRIEPEFPIWCYVQPIAGPATAQRTSTSWVDDWNNTQPAIQTLRDGDYRYRVFPRLLGPAGSFKWGAFINADHWMIDLVDVSTYRLSGGILVSPDQTFPFVGDKLVVEADAAPGAPGMGSADHFYELDVTGAAAPTPWVTDALYGYGQFGGIGAIGCRIEGGLICAMYDSSNRVTGGECPNDGRVCTDNDGRPGRVWETQGVGTANTAASVQGGYLQWPIPGVPGLTVQDVFRHCADNMHDLHCRDRWRMELTRDSIHIFANGYPVMLIDGLFARNPATGADNRVPQAWIDQGARFYMTSWINGGQHTPLRWHWNQVAVNPPYVASAAVSESFCLGNMFNGAPNTCPHAHVAGCPELQSAGTTCLNSPLPPTSTPTPLARTSTPTSLPTSTSVPTSTPTATQVPPSPTPLATVTPTPSKGKPGCPPPRHRKWCF